MSDKTIGVVVPTRWEAKGILRHFGFKRLGHALYRTEINGRAILLCVSGVGRQAATAAARRLLASGSKELVSMGFCGALVPELRVGDLVTDRVITVDRPARTPEERRALTERANAVAVDMETQAVIEAGTRAGVPIRILRVVSDQLEDDLTPMFGQDDCFSAWKIARRLLNPTVWPLAWKLKRHSEVASKSLVQALTQFCQHIDPS